MHRLRYTPRIWLIPTAMFVFLGILSFWVFKRQIDNQATMLKRHTDDVALHAARRLEVFLEAEIRAAQMFARRWSNHESRDFSKERFERFAQILIQDLPGFHAAGILAPDYSIGWYSPGSRKLLVRFQQPTKQNILEQVSHSTRPALAESYVTHEGVASILAVFPLLRKDEFLGFLIVQFLTDKLISTCFDSRVRSEFHFTVSDRKVVLFRSSSDTQEMSAEHQEREVRQPIQVLNQEWNLHLQPKAELLQSYSLDIGLPILILGSILSIGFSLLILLLLRRIELFRLARDQQSHLARKVLHAQEEERSRLSRDLHDELGQLLTALRLEVDWLEKRLPDHCSSGMESMKNATALVEQATTELRRMCSGLRPPLLDDLGLEAAFRSLVAEYQERLVTQIDLRLELDGGEKSISAEIGLCTYRILQESLTNMLRHAKAKNAWINLTANAKELILSIRDDGVGFAEAMLGTLQGLGLEGMRERAHLVGGIVMITSVPHEGTTIIFRASTESRLQKEEV